MTSGIPPETIVKFLWFRGILIILHIFTTTWVFGVQTPAKSKSQKKKTFVHNSPKMKNRCLVSPGLCGSWKHLICVCCKASRPRVESGCGFGEKYGKRCPKSVSLVSRCSVAYATRGSAVRPNFKIDKNAFSPGFRGIHHATECFRTSSTF
mgnify:CR=1 FL=1